MDGAQQETPRRRKALEPRREAGAFTGMTSLLLIEDDPVIGDEIVEGLKPCGYAVRWAKTAKEAAIASNASPSDVMIVDRMLPDGDGLDVLRDLRAGGDRTPALVLSALDRVDQRVAGLRAGGDDYLVKPFAFDELIARVEALLRRPSELPQMWLRLGPLELNLIDASARHGGRDLGLLPREFELLAYMVRRHDQIVTRDMVFREVWRYDFAPRSNLVDVHMSRLRRKLDPTGEAGLIQNVRGIGFKLVATS
jgi:two-component system, OmpR family, response regulator